MLSKLCTRIVPVALCVGVLAAPTTAGAEGTPSSSAAACAAAGGEFTAGQPAEETIEETRTTTRVDTCVVPVTNRARVNTAHKNFAVDFATTTVTEYKTTTTVIQQWRVVDSEPGPIVLNGYRCHLGVFPQAEWDLNDAPPPGSCADVFNLGLEWGFPSSMGPVQVVQRFGPESVDVYGWGAPVAEHPVDGNEVLSVTEAAVGCFNLVSQTYLTAEGVRYDNAHCVATIAARNV